MASLTFSAENESIVETLRTVNGVKNNEQVPTKLVIPVNNDDDANVATFTTTVSDSVNAPTVAVITSTAKGVGHSPKTTAARNGRAISAPGSEVRVTQGDDAKYTSLVDVKDDESPGPRSPKRGQSQDRRGQSQERRGKSQERPKAPARSGHKDKNTVTPPPRTKGHNSVNGGAAAASTAATQSNGGAASAYGATGNSTALATRPPTQLQQNKPRQSQSFISYFCSPCLPCLRPN